MRFFELLIGRASIPRHKLLLNAGGMSVVSLSLLICSSVEASASSSSSDAAALPTAQDVVTHLRARDHQMTNVRFDATCTLKYTPITNMRWPAWTGLTSRFTVWRLGEKLAIDSENFSRDGWLDTDRSVWDGSLLKSSSRTPVRHYQTGEQMGTILNGSIHDAFHGIASMRAASFRMHHLLGILAENAYEQIGQQGEVKLLTQVQMTMPEYLQAVIDLGEGPIKVVRVQEQGRSLVRLQCLGQYFTNRHETYWFDETKDFIPVKYEAALVFDGEVKNKVRYEVLEDAQIDGVWMPKKILLRLGLHEGAAATSEELYDLSNIQFGVVTDEEFALNFPVGGTVVDYPARVAYEVVDETTVKGDGFLDVASGTPVYPTAEEVRAAVEMRPPWPGFEAITVLAAEVPTPAESVAQVTPRTPESVKRQIKFIALLLGLAGMLSFVAWLFSRRRAPEQRH